MKVESREKSDFRKVAYTRRQFQIVRIWCSGDTYSKLYNTVTYLNIGKQINARWRERQNGKTFRLKSNKLFQIFYKQFCNTLELISRRQIFE